MTGIIDYDAGNIRSVEKALASMGEQVNVTRDKDELLAADRVVLPGVGHFGDAMGKLESFGLVDVIGQIAASGKPFLGICLGLQLLFERSDEAPGVNGLGIMRGEILRIPDAEGLKIPHIGWNSLKLQHGGRLFDGIEDDAYVYFVHSYYLRAAERRTVKAVAEYGVSIDASVEQGNVFACQFHPEKSGAVGLRILKNFCSIGGADVY